MRLPRVTVRALMVLVLLAALGSWAGLRARDVYLDPDYHIHAYAHWTKGSPSMTFDGAASPPFWPRFWRHLLGLPWKGQPVCGQVQGHIAESCSFAVPELFPKRQSDRPIPIKHPKAVEDAFARMNKHWEKRNTPGWSPESMPD